MSDRGPRIVPELTRSSDIKLNERVRLRRCVTRLGCVTRQFPQTSGPRMAKPSGDHIPLGGFVRSIASVAVCQNDLFKLAARVQAPDAKTSYFAGQPC